MLVEKRLTAQLLAGPPARDPVAVAERLLAVQAQDGRAVRLAIRARSSGLTAADVDRALSEERSLLITWLNRGTLHLVCRDDYPWLHSLTTPRLFASNARRLAQEGVTPGLAERGVVVIARCLSEEGPLTRAQIGEHLDSAGIPTRGQALVHVLMLAGLRGLTVRGPMIGDEHAYVLVRDWLGESRPVDRDRSLAALARRYLAGHGPAGERDLARWAGLPLRDARRALISIASALDVRPDGLVDLAGRPAVEPLPPPRLLGAYEPLLLGWTSREPFLGSHAGLVSSNGLFRPFALVRGRAVATWSLRGGQVLPDPFSRLSRGDAAALERDANDVALFLGAS
jgi:hypothetical protein